MRDWDSGQSGVNYSITALKRRAQHPARASEIIVLATDHDTNNGIGEDPTAQRGILTPAGFTVKTRKRHRGRDSGDKRGDGGRSEEEGGGTVW